jgi:transcriptional regulator with XRE-family HTH domain
MSAANKNTRGRPLKREEDYNKIFAQRLRDLMSDTTQKDIAAALNVTRQTLGKWTTGYCSPDIVQVSKIAKFFDVSVDYLLGLSDVASPDTDLQGVCRFTGLSEKSVETLIGNPYISIYDAIISNEHTKALIESVLLYEAMKSHFTSSPIDTGKLTLTLASMRTKTTTNREALSAAIDIISKTNINGICLGYRNKCIRIFENLLDDILKGS